MHGNQDINIISRGNINSLIQLCLQTEQLGARCHIFLVNSAIKAVSVTLLTMLTFYFLFYG